MSHAEAECPSDRIMQLMDGVLVAQLIHIVAELGVADLLRHGPLTAEEIAARTHSATDPLYRALRLLATVGVFTESSPRSFALTPMAETLRADTRDSVRDIARMRGGREHWQTWTELAHSVRTGRSAFQHVHGTDLWSYLQAHPDTAGLFDSAMGAHADQVHATTASAYDFSAVHHLVDVGGGQGFLAARLLQRYPELQAVIFDQEHTVRGADRVLTEAGVRDRAELVAGDFFRSVPEGADLYLLSRVLHDWDDEAARSILRAVRAAMPEHATVMVVEAVVPGGDVPHPAKAADIIMLALNEGRERTEEEFAALFEATGLRHAATVPTPSSVSVVLARPSTAMTG